MFDDGMDEEADERRKAVSSSSASSSESAEKQPARLVGGGGKEEDDSEGEEKEDSEGEEEGPPPPYLSSNLDFPEETDPAPSLKPVSVTDSGLGREGRELSGAEVEPELEKDIVENGYWSQGVKRQGVKRQGVSSDYDDEVLKTQGLKGRLTVRRERAR